MRKIFKKISAIAVTSSRLEADPFASDMFNNAVWEWKVYK